MPGGRVIALAVLSLALGACAATPDIATEPASAPEAASQAAPRTTSTADPIGDLIAATPAPASDPAPGPDASEPSPASGASPLAAAGLRGDLAPYLARLRAVSCPAGSPRIEPETIPVEARSVSLQALNPGRKSVGALTYVGGFHLTSGDDRFGGLSGVAVLPNGNLLMVSDQGDMVWIDLADDGATPVAARIAALKDVGGSVLRGKADGDAEGLAVNDGLALVSFERNHRVLAYDIGTCAAAARGAPLSTPEAIPAAFRAADIDVGDNAGPEPLAVTPDWYLFTGLETTAGGAGPLSARPMEAAPEFSLRVGDGAPAFVGLDLLPDDDDGGVRGFSVHRAFNPLSGNAITLVETRFERWLDQTNLPARVTNEIDERARWRYRKTQSRLLAELNLFFTIDNFEGIAARAMPDGRVRLYVVSDDNFSARQRTLLFVFDLPS